MANETQNNEQNWTVYDAWKNTNQAFLTGVQGYAAYEIYADYRNFNSGPLAQYFPDVTPASVIDNLLYSNSNFDTRFYDGFLGTPDFERINSLSDGLTWDASGFSALGGYAEKFGKGVDILDAGLYVYRHDFSPGSFAGAGTDWATGAAIGTGAAATVYGLGLLAAAASLPVSVPLGLIAGGVGLGAGLTYSILYGDTVKDGTRNYVDEMLGNKVDFQLDPSTYKGDLQDLSGKGDYQGDPLLFDQYFDNGLNNQDQDWAFDVIRSDTLPGTDPWGGPTTTISIQGVGTIYDGLPISQEDGDLLIDQWDSAYAAVGISHEDLDDIGDPIIGGTALDDYWEEQYLEYYNNQLPYVNLPTYVPVYIPDNQNDNSGHPAYEPILLDLNNNGLEVTELSESNVFMDVEGTGLLHRTAWAGAGDGVLFYDVNNDGKITEKREYVFTEWDPTADGDLEALRSVFDTVVDGKLTSADAAFANFKVMVTKPDGTQEAQSLTALGITEIVLTDDLTTVEYSDGSRVIGQTTFVRNGVTGIASNMALATEAMGYAVSTSAPQVPAGSDMTVTSTAYNADGSIASITKSVTSANGATIVNSFDSNHHDDCKCRLTHRADRKSQWRWHPSQQSRNNYKCDWYVGRYQQGFQRRRLV
jgi:hypothetical protein